VDSCLEGEKTKGAQNAVPTRLCVYSFVVSTRASCGAAARRMILGQFHFAALTDPACPVVVLTKTRSSPKERHCALLPDGKDAFD